MPGREAVIEQPLCDKAESVIAAAIEKSREQEADEILKERYFNSMAALGAESVYCSCRKYALVRPRMEYAERRDSSRVHSSDQCPPAYE